MRIKQSLLRQALRLGKRMGVTRADLPIVAGAWLLAQNGAGSEKTIISVLPGKPADWRLWKDQAGVYLVHVPTASKYPIKAMLGGE